MDLKIEQNLDLGIQLKRKIGSHNHCILSIPGTARPTASCGTNFPSSLLHRVDIWWKKKKKKKKKKKICVVRPALVP